MIKKDKNGFTLIEVIIAISLFITIVAIGYNALNKINISSKQQQITTDGQNSMNILSKYLTKDLENTRNIQLKLNNRVIVDTSKFNNDEGILKSLEKGKEQILREYKNKNNVQYEYIIMSSDKSKSKNNNDDCTIYRINLEKIDNKEMFRVLRGYGESNIELISNFEFDSSNNELPFTIEGTNTYTVQMGYSKLKSNNEIEFNMYEFTVDSRLNNVADLDNTGGTGTPEDPLDPPKIPEVDDLIEGNTGYVSFEHGYFTKDINYGIAVEQDKHKPCPSSGGLRVSVGGTKDDGTIDRLAYTLGTDTLQQIPIVAIIDPKDNNGKIWAKISEYGDDSGNGNGFYKSKDYFGKSNNINTLNITVTEGAELLDLKINGKYYAKSGKEYKDFKPGKYILTNQIAFDREIKVTGVMKKTSGSGSIVITFGTSI